MERTELAAVILADFDWSDVGAWDAVWEIHERDINGNAVVGPVELLDTQDSLIYSDGSSLTTVLGCRDVVVVSTSDAVLVVARKEADTSKITSRPAPS